MLRWLPLDPGRYQLRFQVQSRLLDSNGTVFVDGVVPDLRRTSFDVSGLVLSSSGQADTTRSGDVSTLMPVVPTSRREFTTSETLSGFLRIYQAGSEPSAVTVTTLQPGFFSCSHLSMHEVSRPPL